MFSKHYLYFSEKYILLQNAILVYIKDTQSTNVVKFNISNYN